MEAMLGKVVQANQKDWDKHLPKVLFAYRHVHTISPDLWSLSHIAY